MKGIARLWVERDCIAAAWMMGLAYRLHYGAR